jgi:hypothetical protein
LGVWGTAIFSDDLASDIRGDYRDAIGDGLTGPEATQRILAQYKSSLADPHESPVVWLALAATQWKLGHLEPEVLQNALVAIDSGADLARWKGSADRARRQAVLEKLRIQLTSPQPEAKKVPRRKLAECNWQVGDLISYRLLSGKRILFRVIGLHRDKGGVYPNCELLDWIGEAVPSIDELRSVPILASKEKRWGTITRLMLLGSTKTAKGRIEPLQMNLPPEPLKQVPSTVLLWKELDEKLAAWFDLK